MRAGGAQKHVTVVEIQRQIRNLVLLLFSHLKISVKGLYQISYCSNSYLKMRRYNIVIRTLLFAPNTELRKHRVWEV